MLEPQISLITQIMEMHLDCFNLRNLRNLRLQTLPLLSVPLCLCGLSDLLLHSQPGGRLILLSGLR